MFGRTAAPEVIVGVADHPDHKAALAKVHEARYRLEQWYARYRRAAAGEQTEADDNLPPMRRREHERLQLEVTERQNELSEVDALVSAELRRPLQPEFDALCAAIEKTRVPHDAAKLALARFVCTWAQRGVSFGP